jgi:hypothetical protein
MENPKISHCKVVKLILRYIADTRDYGIWEIQIVILQVVLMIGNNPFLYEFLFGIGIFVWHRFDFMGF